MYGPYGSELCANDTAHNTLVRVLATRTKYVEEVLWDVYAQP